MHALTQLGTIAFAYGLRQWLGRRFGYLADGDRAGSLARGAAHPSSLLSPAQSSG